MSIAGASSGRVSKLIKLLAEEQAFTSIEIAETLWLAMQIEPASEGVPDIAGLPQLMPPQMPSISPPPSFEPELPPPLPSQAAPRANIVAPTPQVGVLPPQTLPVWLADPAMLTDALAIIRALKPLLQKVAARTGKRLNEPATVDNIARTHLCLPILEPEQQPWFDIIVVVDRGSSMHIWQRLVKDIVSILRRYGAFRDVQVFDLVVNQAAHPTQDVVQLISKPDRPGHQPSELIDQRGQRIVIVLSDCAGSYWWAGTLLPMLQNWGTVMPTVVWQMLPAWMWKRTALGRGTAIAISNDIPGATNQRLKIRIQERKEPGDAKSRISVPVVTSDVRDLASWSLMVTGDRRAVTPGFLLPQQGGAIPRSKGIEEIARDRAVQSLDENANPDTALNQALDAIARERVDRFLELASPEAQRLIMLLAAAPVITLPVVRLIRDAMLHEAQSPLPVAEVFLSGLLLRLSNQEDAVLERVLQEEGERVQAALEQQALTQTEDDELKLAHVDKQELIQYDFAPKVRSILLETLPTIDTIEVINSVSAAIEQRWNQFSVQDFRAFLTNPDIEAPEGLEGLRSFASVTADILEPLGGEYANFARQLRVGAGEEPPEPLQENDFPLEDVEFEVAKLIDFPPIQSCEYESATITAILDRFDFETACLATPSPSPQGNKAYQKLLENYLLATIPAEADIDLFFEEIFSSYPDPPVPIPALRLRTSDRRLKVAEIVKEICHDGQLIRILTERLCEQDAKAHSVLLEGAVFRHRAVAWGYTESLLDASADVEISDISIDASAVIGLDMIAIPGGSFTMGAPESEPESRDNERPQHKVILQPFYLGRYPITQAQWRVVAGYERINRDLDPDPSSFKGNQRPVENVSWDDTQEFCQRLSVKIGKTYRLPSEAEWEYACRAGTETPFHFGEKLVPELANYDTKVSYSGSPTAKSRGETTEVGSFPANDWGLHDMHGNVLEWCEDDWHSVYEEAPTDGSAWVFPERTDVSKLLRGGSLNFHPRDCRSAVRNYVPRDDRYFSIGFRVCCKLPVGVLVPARVGS